MMDAACRDLGHDDVVNPTFNKAVFISFCSPLVLSILNTMLNPRNYDVLCLDDELARILRDFGKNLAAEEALGEAAGALQSWEGSVVAVSDILDLVRYLHSVVSGERRRSHLEENLAERALSTGAQCQLGEWTAAFASTFKRSDAQLTFECDLLHCAHDFYANRLRSVLAGATLVGQSGADLSPSQSLSVIREFSWTPHYWIGVMKSTRFSRSDTVKSFVESHLGETWNWWPLAPASHRLRAGYYRLQWKSVCAPEMVMHPCGLR